MGHIIAGKPSRRLVSAHAVVYDSFNIRTDEEIVRELDEREPDGRKRKRLIRIAKEGRDRKRRLKRDGWVDIVNGVFIFENYELSKIFTSMLSLPTSSYSITIQ